MFVSTGSGQGSGPDELLLEEELEEEDEEELLLLLEELDELLLEELLLLLLEDEELLEDELLLLLDEEELLDSSSDCNSSGYGPSGAFAWFRTRAARPSGRPEALRCVSGPSPSCRWRSQVHQEALFDCVQQILYLREDSPCNDLERSLDSHTDSICVALGA
jgi:hypothetical protein